MKPIIAELASESGVTQVALKKWRQRGKVPHLHRIALLTAAEKRGVKIRLADFDFAIPKRRQRAAA